jgi:SAM-dependent methyltransferase
MSSEICPICSGGNTLPVFSWSKLPTMLHTRCRTKTLAMEIPTAPVHYVGCATCGFVWNTLFDPKIVVYDARYENTSKYFEQYIKDSNELLDFIEPLGDTVYVLEVACGQGDFLQIMAEKLGSRLKAAVGIDPAVRTNIQHHAIHLFSEYFNVASIKEKEFAPNVVIALDYIEHIISPIDFIKQLQEIDSMDKIILKTANFEYILDTKLYYEFTYEHCSLFMPQTLLGLMDRIGFVIVKLQKIYKEINMCVVGERNLPPPPRTCTSTLHNNQFCEIYNLYEKLYNFSCGQKAFVENCKTVVRNAYEKYGTLAIAGSSGKGNIFLSFLEDNASLIAACVEINPNKQGCFLPVTGIPIVSPQESKDMGIQCLVLLTDVFFEAIKRQHADIDHRVAFILPEAFKK